ncbi:MAG: restriction endonuclease subunit S [Candidatus Wallbacteria bacterium HGW-Wallbacteria-1]|jgi:type I restriction enzyme S subunit|uniref:Restriction endonuclease subunit S n=1 Tax=Candidatus Wallbacteria bacterium HGW-Wallbacteria-1 TaxID=2013854 RepID=A0A2N1PJE1_9BACT|nr:MAG: restriction endonuclease subunit S [Candidatus Wallbacteria bacterium HGW-Wallbacteria-1]
MSELPKGWVEITLEDFGIPNTKNVEPQKQPYTTYELWSVPAYPDNRPEYVSGKEIASSKQKVLPGDILLCKINPRINRVWRVQKTDDEFEKIASTEWIVLRNIYIHDKYCQYYLRSEKFRNLFCSELSGVGGSLTRARPKIIAKYPFPLPPLGEQKRIVRKIEALKERSDRAKEALGKIPSLIEKFRQSVLASAFRGDLTREWREKNPDVEPASELLERIRKERRQRWEEAELEKMRAKGKEPRDDNWKAKYKEPERVDATGLPELPEGWCWARLEEVAEWITKGTTPNSELMKQIEEIPYIKVYNLTFNGTLDHSITPTFVSRKTHNEILYRSKCYPGDVLMNIVGPPLGKVSLVPANISECNINQAIAVFRPILKINNELLAFYLIKFSQEFEGNFKAKATAGQHNLTLEICRNIPFPVMPQKEQSELLNKIKKLYFNIEKTSTDIQDAFVRLNQSILAKAFRGELVPQDSDDEPASVLLERIREEKGRSEKKGKRGK